MSKGMTIALLQGHLCDAQRSLDRAAQCLGTKGSEQEAVYEFGRLEGYAKAIQQAVRHLVGSEDLGVNDAS